eukprot:c729_g1_i1 orf=98-295(-)
MDEICNQAITPRISCLFYNDMHKGIAQNSSTKAYKVGYLVCCKEKKKTLQWNQGGFLTSSRLLIQ